MWKCQPWVACMVRSKFGVYGCFYHNSLLPSKYLISSHYVPQAVLGAKSIRLNKLADSTPNLQHSVWLLGTLGSAPSDIRTCLYLLLTVAFSSFWTCLEFTVYILEFVSIIWTGKIKHHQCPQYQLSAHDVLTKIAPHPWHHLAFSPTSW